MAEGHSGGGAGTTVAGAESSHVEPPEAALFIITCILIGVSTQFFLKRLKVPYTALLLIFGLGIGLLQAAAPKTEAFTATLELWMGIDPHVLLLIFLPTIAFSAALSQEPHLLRRNWGQILILAWPGVVVTFILIGVCARYFFPYGWTWPQSLLFGAMLSATDPVAVVAVLHEVGADEKLSSVIDGESLVNDGSALVIFLVLQQFVQGASLTVREIVASFAQLALLGALIGLGFGLLTSFWLANIWNDPGLEIVLTLGAAYGCYFVSEELCGASGLLAVVVMGFSMSLLGGRHITNRIKVEMHAFWSVLEWLANTMLFIWVGIALGFVLLEPSSPQLQTEVKFSHWIRPADAGYAVVLYLWLLVARGTAIALFYPLLSTGRIGYRLTWQSAIFMTWAGLRGAVGVAMSLFILLDPLIESEEFKAHCVFYMALMAASTVLINGSTSKYVLEGLGLLKMSPQQLDVLQYVLKEVDGIADATLSCSDPDDVLGPPDSGLVKKWSAVGAAASLSAAHHRVLRRLKAMASGGRPGSKGSARTDATVAAALEDGPGDRTLRELRARLLHVVKASYGDMYQHFELTTPGIRLLQEATDKALDAATGTAAPTAADARSHSSSRQSSARIGPAAGSSNGQPGAAGTGADAESGAGQTAGSNGLTDWQETRQALEAPTWSGWFSMVAGKLGMVTVAEGLSQREVAAKLMLVSSFVAAHSIAQQVLGAHLTDSSQQHTTDSTQTDSQTPADSNSQLSANNNSSQGQDLPDKKKVVAAAPAGAGSSDGDAAVAQRVLQESRAEADAALQYAHQVLLPQHPGLGRLLMSRHVAIQVLERQTDFLDSIEEAGLVRAEEIHTVQHKAATRLERLQHHRAWNIIKLEHQEAARVAAEGGTLPPRVAAAASSTGCTSAEAPGLPAGERKGGAAVSVDRGAGVQQQEKQGGGVEEAGPGPGGRRQTGVMLDELTRVKSSLRQRANRAK